jgi:hypothetical protein
VLSSAGQHEHLVSVAEISHEFHNKANIGHLVQQILILKLFRQFESDSLQELTCALAVAPSNLVVDHFACFALQILHLVIHQAFGQNI